MFLLCCSQSRMSLLAAIFLNAIALSTARYGCKNPQGKAVDWWVVYKMPKISDSEPPISEGFGHFYMDGSTTGWQKGSSLADENGHAIVETLKQLYAAQKASGEQFIAMYNDDWPLPYTKKTTTNYGHTKGNLVFDKEGGYWMIHSTPRFPSAQEYEWPHSATLKGQSFLCISFNYDQLIEIAKQLTYNQPWLYYNKLTPGIEKDIPDLRSIIDLEFVKAAPFARTSCLMSRGGMAFTSFAKHRNWHNDVYYAAVAATLKVKMHAETWIVGNGDLPAWCGSGFEIHNVTQITIDGNSFETIVDHSKWAVADDCAKDQWICIGDINRQVSQFIRGGGLVCFQHKTVCQNYRKLIANTIGCGRGGESAPKLDIQPSIHHECAINVQHKCAEYAAEKAAWCTKGRRVFVTQTCGANFCA